MCSAANTILNINRKGAVASYQDCRKLDARLAEYFDALAIAGPAVDTSAGHVASLFAALAIDGPLVDTSASHA